jgi:hypothetical protein
LQKDTSKWQEKHIRKITSLERFAQHFRPSEDDCVKQWPENLRICSNLANIQEVLASIKEYEARRDCDYYVAHPEFLSEHGISELKKQIRPKMMTKALAAQYSHGQQRFISCEA